VKTRTLLGTVALLGALGANSAMAMEQGDWLVRFGGSYVNPASNNHPLVSVDSASSLTFNFSYMMTRNWSVEVLAAYPFEHDITLDGAKVASTKHLPPTVTLQYHFMPDAKFQPYVGAGVNYTTFFSQKTYGPLEGADLSLGDSWGLAGEIGADFMLNDTWFLNGSIRYIGIETDAKLNSDSIGDVSIDPWVYSINAGLRF
jgi:outer membrane protein